MVGKLVVVTGASRGLGEAIASKLANEGYDLIITSTQMGAESLKRVADKCLNLGSGKCEPVIESGSIKTAEKVSEISTRFESSVWGIVNNAGMLSSSSFPRGHTIDREEVFDLHYGLPYQLVAGFWGNLSTTGGRIINISSMSVTYGMGRDQTIDYAASKAALECASTAWSRIGAPLGILSNCIAPGVMRTTMQSKEMIDAKMQRIPTRKTTELTEVSSLCSLLMDTKSNITGQVIRVAGGE